MPKAIGLIEGDFFGKGLNIFTILFTFKKTGLQVRSFLQSISVKHILYVAKEYKSFPLYFLPSSLLIYLSGHLPIYFFQLKYGAVLVGAFALSSSMLEIFNRLIPYALSPVFLQKASELRNVSHAYLCERVYKLFLYMSLLSVVIFSSVTFLAELTFPLVFGEKWILAGRFAVILSISYAFNFVAVALSEIYNVMGRQRFLLVNSFFTVILKILSIVVIVHLGVSGPDALIIYSMVNSICGMFLIIGVFVILDFKVFKVFILSFAAFLFLVVCFLLNEIIRGRFISL